KARLIGGFTIELASTGYFGGRWVNGEYRDGAKHVMTDNYTIPVLNARSCSVLKVRFLDSQAGYCSAIFLQRYPFGTPIDSPPTPEMLFAASHNDDYNDGMGDNDLTVTKYIDAGTQMNFFIGVDQNCSTRPGGPTGPTYKVREYDVSTHPFRASDYDHLHYALDIDVEELREMEESIWALVEQHPVDNQRWRIGWEDIHNTSWDRPEGTDPRNSLQALKLYGYDLNNDGRGDGWTRPSPTDYRRLRDGQLDLSDQVVEVTLEPVDPAITGGECSVYRIAGNDPTPGGGDDDLPDDDPPGDDDPPSDDDGGSGDDGSIEPPPPPPSTFECGCPRGGGNGKKVAIMHRPPGNEANEHIICVSRSGADTHLRQHNDFEVCEGN
ncbi:MAG TPA: hypothetical protein VK002_00355, partial [Rubricoccaceae bacterium]|nr:hypothetical protein [Rubricoccaceae bacterium]